MCPARMGQREKGFMSLELYKKIVDDIHHARIEFPSRFPSSFIIYIQGIGSPLLSQDLFDMIKYTKERGIRIGFSTNVQELNETNAENLLKAGIDVLELSVYALNREKYRHIHGVDKMELVFKNMIRLLHLSRNSSIKIVANILVSERALSEVLFLNWLYIQLPFHKVENILIRNFHGMFEEAGLTDEIEFLRDIKHGLIDVPVFSEMIKDKSTIPDMKKKIIKENREETDWQCPWNSMMIFWNGDVDPCVTDYGKRYIVGNVKEEKISEIWNNDRYKRFRRAVMNDDDIKDIGFEFCNNCSYYSLGKGTSVIVQVGGEYEKQRQRAFLIKEFPLNKEEEWLNTLETLKQTKWEPIQINS